MFVVVLAEKRKRTRVAPLLEKREERSGVLGEDPASTRPILSLFYRKRDRCISLVCRSHSPRLPLASATLGGAGTACKGFDRQIDET